MPRVRCALCSDFDLFLECFATTNNRNGGCGSDDCGGGGGSDAEVEVLEDLEGSGEDDGGDRGAAVEKELTHNESVRIGWQTARGSVCFPV